MNDHLGMCIVCPLSSKIKNYAGCLVLKKDLLNGLARDSEVITFKVRTISGERLISKTGEISIPQLEILKKGLVEVLTY
jgi:mRNA interferase MazF